MASMQYFKTAEQTYTYSQGQCHASHPSQLVNTETQCTSKTNAYDSETGLAKTQTAQCHSLTQTANSSHYNQSHSHGQTPGYGYVTSSTTHTHGHGLCLPQNQGSGLGHTTCNGMADASGRRCGRGGDHKRRGLFQRMKDGLSGDNSCSSSDSESDNEHCGTRVFRRQNC